jgi:CheY-like chemotaxis protein
MTSILVVEDDEQLRSAVTRDLSHRGFDVTAVVSVDDALSQLHRRGYDVLLTDLRMGERDGIDLLVELADLAPGTRPILMSAYASARDHQRAIELGAVQVLCKPFTSLELTHAIKQAIECESGFRGSLHGLSLIDVLQMFHFNRRSLCVTVGGRHGGAIHVKGGEIVHAEQEGVTGEGALRRMLGMNSGSIRTGPLEGEQRSIERSFQELVLDVLRELDEDKKDDFAVGDDAFDPIEGVVATKTDGSTTDASGVCADIVSRVEGALLCGIVDLERRRLLGLHDRQALLEGNNDVLVEDTVDLLENPNLIRFEKLVGSELGSVDDEPDFQELRIVAPDTCRLTITIQGGRYAVVLVTRRETNPGLAFWYLRSTVAAFERNLATP